MALPARMELDSMEDVFLQDDLGLTIAEHAFQCSDLFNKYMSMPEVTPDPTLMDDQLARFTLWASNMDVFGPLNVSLDYRLRYSPTVVDIIHQLLGVICNALASLKPIDDSSQAPSRKKRRISKKGNTQEARSVDNDTSDSDSDEDEAQKNVSLITHTIGGTVTRLFRLSNAIRKSAKVSRACKIGRYRDDEEANNAIAELRHYTECYIRFRFPQAPEALRSALIEANALRLRRLCYQRSHRRRIALSIQRPQQALGSFQLPQILGSAPTVRFASDEAPKRKAIDERPKAASSAPVPLTNATNARQTAVEALYADSSIGAPKAKSVLVNNKLSFPPVPTTGECPYCSVIVDFEDGTKTTMWNDHVISDLEPFICVYAHCIESSQQEPGSLTFETSKAWMSHMQNAHGYGWECRAPSHDPVIFEQEFEFQDHACKEHSVPEAHVTTLSGAARRLIPEKILECPFGDGFSAPEKDESNTVFSNESLSLHVATHMKEIALLALQKLPNDDNEFEDVASDAPLKADGVSRLRGSMYSVLDDERLDFLEEAEDGVSNIPQEGVTSSVDRLDLEVIDEAGITSPRTEMGYRNMTPEKSDEMFKTMIDQNTLFTVPDHPHLQSHDTEGRKSSSFVTIRTPYTVASESPSERVKGGRQPGSRLPEADVQNVRQVRWGGACIKCTVLTLKCSSESPCMNCLSLNKTGGWAGCLRSFSEIASLLKPDILLTRLQFQNMQAWMSDHVYFPPGQEKFELPLDFGFGELFNGLYGVEYEATTDEPLLSDILDKSDKHLEQPQIRLGIPVCAVWSSADGVQRGIWQWLKQTLTSSQSIRKWLQTCFHGSDVEWIHELLLSTWKYSVRYWQDSEHHPGNEFQQDEILLEAWMAALLAGMLWLPITIPQQVVDNIRPQLRFASYDPSSHYSRTSRALTRSVKSLLYDMYQQFVGRLASTLREFRRLPEHGSIHNLRHIYCIAILIMVITCQLQTSLIDNGRLVSIQSPATPNFLEETFEQLRGVESAFKNSILFVLHTTNRWLKKSSISHTDLPDFPREIWEIRQKFHDVIKSHHKIDLEELMSGSDSDAFHTPNMQRVFAFFLTMPTRHWRGVR